MDHQCIIFKPLIGKYSLANTFFHPTSACPVRLPLLLLLLIPVHTFAQYRPIHSPTPPRPLYTPAPVRPGPTHYQQQQYSQQYARQTFQRMQAQQMQNMQMHQYVNRQQQALAARNQQAVLMRRYPTSQQLETTQALQQKSEQEASEKLAQLAQEQQRKRQEAPASDPQQAAAQQQEDDKQLNLLTVANYNEVFLPGQVYNALQARRLSPQAHKNLQNINQDLLSNAWWSKQDAAQLNGKIAAHGSALTALATDLLGYDLASPPAAPAPPSVSRLDEQLANHTFDQQAATQLIREAALAEKLLAGDRLSKAVRDFNTLAATAAASPALPVDSKKLRNDVKASLRQVNTELQRFDTQLARSRKIAEAQGAILATTYKYLAANAPAKKKKQ